MAEIIDTVGPGGVNAIHDVVLIQLMLKTVKNSHKTAYFSPPYTLTYSNDTARAITAFQTDQGLIGGSPDAGRPDAGSVEVPGLAKPGGGTWQALRAAFVRAAPAYLDARTTKGAGLAYLPMPQGRMSASVGAINGAKNLQSTFRHKVVQLVQNFYQQSSIAWSLIPDTGGWRSFAGQEGLTSDAGYGESIHQFGYAVDIAIPNFSWIAPDLLVRTSAVRLDGVDPEAIKQIYAARDKLAGTLKLYRTTLPGDIAHLQNFDDEPLDSVSSLMALMHAVGPKAMNWKPRYRTPTDYLCDVGLGGDHYFVGTAIDIWEHDTVHRISPEDLVKALLAKKKRDPKFSAAAFLGRPGKDPPEPAKAGDISTADIKAVQKMLRAEFDAAAAKWTLWKPVDYPNKDRRPPNPVKRAKKKK